MSKTITEINDKIRKGAAVVVDAEEIISIVREKGPEAAAREVDVVTTGAFGPMCSSGIYFNIGHSNPKIKLGGGRVSVNGVPAYAGLAAVDLYLGATALRDDDPRNARYPGEFPYGGGRVIEDLVAGRDVELVGEGYGSDCYPRRKLETRINLKDLNEAVLFNPRNAYQNYNVAVNLSRRTIYTYMGTLKPELGNANYCSAGQLSPLLCDPTYRTIGIGTRIFLGGGVGYVVWQGTQHNPNAPRHANGLPKAPAGTLAVLGDLKGMSSQWLKGATFTGYGVTLVVGIGIPIPVLDVEVVKAAAVRDSEITARIVDYSDAYPNGKPEIIGEIDYGSLKSGEIEIRGKKVRTAPLSSYAKAREIATILKNRILKGEFALTAPVAPIPGPGAEYSFKPLKERSLEECG